jgi:hypothetical protein
MYPKAIEPYFAPTPTGLDIKREASRLWLNFGSLPHIRSFRIVRRIFQTDKPEILLRFAFIRESVLFRTRRKQRQRQPFGVSARNVFRGRSVGADGISTSGVRRRGLRERVADGFRVSRFATALIGSIRRECLDHVIVFGEAHLRRVLKTYASYYNEVRTHLSLDKHSPDFRRPLPVGDIAAIRILGGLHHQYVWL